MAISSWLRCLADVGRRRVKYMDTGAYVSWLERHGMHVNHKKVYLSMDGLFSGVRLRRRYVRMQFQPQCYPSLFNVISDKLNEKWVTDYFYAITLQGTLYLSILRYIFDNRIIVYWKGKEHGSTAPFQVTERSGK